MKRFYREASAAPAEGGFAILLDGRPVKTPARNPLLVPAETLGMAIATEWNEQGEEIDPRAMPLTGLANAAIDRVAPDPAVFAGTLAAYGESDLLCYRAEGPPPLVRRQEESWDWLLAWARQRYDVDFETACGVIHRAQPAETVDRLARAVAARDPFRLAALSPLVTISGSLVIALALAEGAIGPDSAWAAATLDEAWQAEQWGADSLAFQALEARRRDFGAACLFLTLLQAPPRSARPSPHGRAA
ncbi:MAG TPA: ATP12 family protein [Allosphingosinicella sp.]|nr:ATP12 family protein [Allosphingosinicella sp.]